MEFEPWSPAERGLRAHVEEVAEALGCTGTAFLVETDGPLSAYLPLDHHFYGFPERDAALLWDAHLGWAAAVEDSAPDSAPLIIAYLGHPWPEAADVSAFVARLVEGRPAFAELNTALAS